MDVPGWPGWTAYKNGTISAPSGENLKLGKSKNGHLCFYARKFYWNRYSIQWVHRFVAYAFVSNPRPDIFRVVDHIDRNPTNNVPSNLRWVTHQLNSLNKRTVNAYYNSSRKKWLASVTVHGQQHKLGFYDSREAASNRSQTFKQETFQKIYDEYIFKKNDGRSSFL